MLTLPLPEAFDLEGDLVPASRTTKSDRAPPHRLPGWVALAEPVSTRLTSALAATDAELQRFILAEAESFVYHAVHFACTFKPDDGAVFERAWLAIELARADGGDGPGPLAWSMHPRRCEGRIERSHTVRLGAELKLIGEAATPAASVEWSTTAERRVLSLEALNELRSDPLWEFTATEVEPLRGAYRLSMVVRSPAFAGTVGTVHLTANVRRRRFGVVAYRAVFAQRPTTRFQLDGTP